MRQDKVKNKNVNYLDFRVITIFFPIMQKVYWALVVPSLNEKGITKSLLITACMRYGMNIKQKDFDMVYEFEELNIRTMHFFMICLHILQIPFEYALHLTYADIKKIVIFAETHKTKLFLPKRKKNEKNSKVIPKPKHVKKRDIQGYI